MNSYKLLEKISFERLAGSNEELEAAKIIKETVEELGVQCEIEPFEIEYPINIKASFEVISPEYAKFDVIGYGMTCDADNLEAEFLYCDNLDEISLAHAKGKIIMFNGGLPFVNYKKIYEAGVAGFICFNGSVYEKEIDINEGYLRAQLYQLGKIPGVGMTIHDASRLVRMNPKTVRMSLSSEVEKRQSHNVVATIPGEINEVVAFTAHFDSVRYSKGVYDNASGSVGIYDILKYYVDNKPKRTLKFVWCGAEERGLLGSKAYTESHKEELKDYRFNINIDMIGVVLGYDTAVVSGDNSIVNYVQYYAKEVGYPITSKQGVYPSDSTPFADCGVPSMTFARLNCVGGAQIHSNKDVIDHMSEDAMNKTMSFIIPFSAKIVNSNVMPIAQEIPQNIKDDLDKYMMRKEK